MSKENESSTLANIALCVAILVAVTTCNAHGETPKADELTEAQKCAIRLIQNTDIIKDLGDSVSVTPATVFAFNEHGGRIAYDENAPVTGMEFRVSFKDRMGYNTIIVQNDKRVGAGEITVNVTNGRPGPVNAKRAELATELKPPMFMCL